MSKTKKQTLIDGVIFSADPAYDAKHPRDAHGHFVTATDGPDDLKAMLQEINDPAARLIAADRMADLGREQEADMLRNPAHPLVAIGGGVFYAPGHRGAANEETNVQYAKGRTPRLIHVIPPPRRQIGHVVNVTANGFTSVFGTHGSGVPYTLMNRIVADRGKAGPQAVKMAKSIANHQIFAEADEHFAATPKAVAEMTSHLLKRSIPADPKARPVAAVGAKLVEGDKPKNGYVDQMPLGVRHHEASASSLRSESRRRRRAGGLTFTQSERIKGERIIPHVLEDQGFIPDVSHTSDGLTQIISYHAPSRRQLALLRRHGNEHL